MHELPEDQSCHLKPDAMEKMPPKPWLFTCETWPNVLQDRTRPPKKRVISNRNLERVLEGEQLDRRFVLVPNMVSWLHRNSALASDVSAVFILPGTRCRACLHLPEGPDEV